MPWPKGNEEFNYTLNPLRGTKALDTNKTEINTPINSCQRLCSWANIGQ